MTEKTTLKLGKIMDTSAPANANATAETKALYRFMKSLCGAKQYLLGTVEMYHDWLGKADADWTASAEMMERVGGRYPGHVMHDYTAITTPGVGLERYNNMRRHVLDQDAMGWRSSPRWAVVELNLKSSDQGFSTSFSRRKSSSRPR